MSIGTSIQTIDIPAVIDANKVSNFQKWILILVGLTVVMDGFDVQAMGYVAPVIIKEWGVAKSMLGPVFGAGYVVVAVKRAQGPKLVGAAWKTAPVRAGASVPIANRNGSTASTAD